MMNTEKIIEAIDIVGVVKGIATFKHKKRIRFVRRGGFSDGVVLDHVNCEVQIHYEEGAVKNFSYSENGWIVMASIDINPIINQITEDKLAYPFLEVLCKNPKLTNIWMNRGDHITEYSAKLKSVNSEQKLVIVNYERLPYIEFLYEGMRLYLFEGSAGERLQFLKNSFISIIKNKIMVL